MKKQLVRVILLLAVSIVCVSSVYAEVKLDYGADFRLRQELWINLVSLNTITTPTTLDRDFFRLRYRLWGKADFDNNYGAYLRFTGEPKEYLGDFPSWFLPHEPRNDTRLNADEIVFDNLYADAKKILNLPIDIRIGRQDFIGTYGEGFLLMDGTPGDGSRTFYFNAIKANVQISQNMNFDLTYITDPKTDIYLPSLHEGSKVQLTGSNEQAFLFYGRGRFDKLTVEPYYIYKTEQPVNTAGSIPSKLKLNTVGARLLYSVDKWNMGGEFAYQFGEYDNGVDRTGAGGYVFVGRKYEDVMWKPEFELRYVYLSGDKSGTADKIETWDPLFSRNPYWNELFIYTQIIETAKYGGNIPGYWTNLEIFKASAKANFSPATSLALSYQYLWAPQSTSGLPAPMFTNSGHSRGHLPTALLSHKFSKNLDGYLQLEYFIPENFYSGNADNATFFRWQLQYKL